MTKFMQLNAEYFKQGADIEVFSIVHDIDITSIESQGKILDFYEKMARCYLCEETWFKDQILWKVWYSKFNDYVREGNCMLLPEGLTAFEKFIPPEIFYPCLH